MQELSEHPGSLRICSAEMCDRPHAARGYCDAHYRRFRAGLPIDDYPIRGSVTACPIGECGRPVKAYGLCNVHHYRRRDGRRIDAPLINRKKHRTASEVLARDDEGRKHCPYCDRWLPTEHFRKMGGSSDGLNWKCAECSRAQQQGTSVAALAVLYESQGGCCAICSRPLAGRFTIDHDHACCPNRGQKCGKCMRSLLCGACNVALGMMREDRETIEAMSSYIQYWHDRLRKEGVD